MRVLPTLCLVLVAALAGAVGRTEAQGRMPSHCIGLVQNTPGLRVVPVSYTDSVPADSVRIHYIDHAMFLIQTEDGLSAVTDYTGLYGTDFVPDVVTMNNAHSSHWTTAPDPRIPHVLEGWGTAENPREHYLELGGMLVRNVQTDTRSGGGTRVNGNSIFVFEAAGLCIGHLGHLHHEPSPEEYAALGRLDVVMAAVDGGLTVNQETMIRILERLQSSVVIPMHWFGRGTLDRFVSGMQPDFAVDRTGSAEITLSLRSLPDRPTVVVLEPRPLSSE